MFKTIFNRLILLNKAHQVHYSYNNVEKAMAHAFMLTIFNCCSYNNQFKTGSIFLRHNGFIRFFCNGFMDEIFELSSRF